MFSNTSVYRSDDGGKTFIPIKGAPGGDDYHQLWIYPDDGQRMILSSDQGTVVSVDGGLVWSSWYNQPTAQIYHIVADNQDPYWVYGAQQDSGAVKAVSRGIYGSISYMRDWAPICAGGEAVLRRRGSFRFKYSLRRNSFGVRITSDNAGLPTSRRCLPRGSWAVSSRPTGRCPLVPEAPGLRYISAINGIVEERWDRGKNWARISKDMTRENPGVPPNLDAATASRSVRTFRDPA